jgi:hypothetical protein
VRRDSRVAGGSEQGRIAIKLKQLLLFMARLACVFQFACKAAPPASGCLVDWPQAAIAPD